MTNAAPEPFHNPMESLIECDLANDRVAVLEADLAAMTEERDRLQEQFKIAFRFYLQDADVDLGGLLESEGAEYVARYQPAEEDV